MHVGHILFGLLFAFWRCCEIVTLIPVVGMLSYFVHLYIGANALTPDAILVPFIVAVLAVVWALGTLFTFHRSKDNSRFVAFIDLLFVGAFIGGAWALRGIAPDNCAKLSADGGSYTADFGLLGSVRYGGYGIKLDKTCGMLKAAWAFGIMNALFFTITSFFVCLVHRGGDKEAPRVRDEHASRRGQRSNSHRSRRSEHSGRHAYV